MIEAFRRIGEEILKEIKMKSETKWKKAILETLSIEPLEGMKEIMLIFDLDNKKIEIKESDSDINRNENTFCFSLSSGNEKNIFLGSNNFYYHLKGTIPNLFNTISEEAIDFRKFLKEIIKSFYFRVKVIGEKDNETQGAYLLNISKFLEEYKMFLKELNKQRPSKENMKKIEQLMDSIDNIKKGTAIKKEEFDSLSKFFERYYFKYKFIDYISNSKDYIYRIYFKINGKIKSILETEYSEKYIEVCYKQILGRFFLDKRIRDKKIDFLTGNRSFVTNNVSLKIKFYTTTLDIYFENCSGKKNRYKGFSVNKKTFEELLIGMDYVLKNLNFYFHSNYLLVPKTEDFYQDLSENTGLIKKDLKKIEGTKKKHEILKELSEKRDWSFDMMFYERDKSAFNVFKIINDLSYFNLKEISEIIGEINGRNREVYNVLNKKFENYSLFNLNQFWRALYLWTNLTKFKDKKIIYRIEFLDYLDSIYNRRKIKNDKLIKKFLFNIKKHYYNKKQINPIILNSFNSLIFLIRLGLIKMEKTEKKELFAKELSNNDLKHFFEIHPEIFGPDIKNGVEKQGLVLLGYLVNQVNYSQGEKSKNFINKINFDGIKKEKLKKFITKVIEFLNIYSTKDNPLLKYNNKLIMEMNERILNIINTDLSREEITYYILLGNFLGFYIGIKNGKQSGKENENNLNKKDLVEKDGNKK